MVEQNFKEYCKKAKNRFKNGYWSNFSKLKEQKIIEAKNTGKSEEEVVKKLTRIVKSEVRVQSFGVTNEDELYKKVVEILSSDEIILNPIMRLVDESYYETLTENEKQGYILELSQTFERLRNKYNLEKDA